MKTSLTFNRILSIAMLAALIGTGVQVGRWNEQLVQLSQRMSTLETQSAAAKQVRYAALNPLQHAGIAGQSQASRASKIQTRAEALPTNARQPAMQAELDNVEPTSRVFAEMAQQGYIDDHMWQAFDERIKGMSQAENKVFWQQMSAAIEKGDVAVHIGPK